MREYSENLEAEFSTLVERADSGARVRMTLFCRDGPETYTIEGKMCGVESCILTLKDTKLDLSGLTDSEFKKFVRRMHRGTAHIPLGDYVKNYEILTPPVFDATEERKQYREYVRKRYENASITDLIWGNF